MHDTRLTIIGPSRGGRRNDDGGDYAIIHRDENGHNRVVGEAFRLVDLQGGEDIYADALANATLWSLAPELLDVCEVLVEWIVASFPDAEDRPQSLLDWAGDIMSKLSPKSDSVDSEPKELVGVGSSPRSTRGEERTMQDELKRTPEWARQYVSDAELAMQDAEALRAAGNALAARARDAKKFVAKYVCDTESVIGSRALNALASAIEAWEDATETAPATGRG